MQDFKAQMPDAIRELKWKEIMSRVDAYRFYIKLCLEANAFFFAAVGVILGFYLKEPTGSYLKFFLLLPILMGTVLGSICIYARSLQKEGARIIEKVREELEMKHKFETEEVPDIDLLELLLLIFGLTFFLVATLLIPVPLLKGPPSVGYFIYSGIALFILFVGGIKTCLGIRKHNNLLKANEIQRRLRRYLRWAIP